MNARARATSVAARASDVDGWGTAWSVRGDRGEAGSSPGRIDGRRREPARGLAHQAPLDARDILVGRVRVGLFELCLCLGLRLEEGSAMDGRRRALGDWRELIVDALRIGRLGPNADREGEAQRNDDGQEAS